MRHVMMLLLGSGLALLPGFALAAPASAPPSAPDACARYAPAKARLEQVYAEYGALPKTAGNAGKLFLLYQRLEQIGQGAQALYPGRGWGSQTYEAISRCLVDPQFAELGVYVGHYSARLEYSEKLLAEAHRLDPNTPYRRYTLYAAVLGNTIGEELPDLPDVARANQYLQEFPEGPYATDVHLLLAGFYHDLFMSLRYGESVMGDSNSCYAEYAARHPHERDPERARRLAILHLQQALAATPPDKRERAEYARELATLKQGASDNVIHWCTD